MNTPEFNISALPPYVSYMERTLEEPSILLTAEQTTQCMDIASRYIEQHGIKATPYQLLKYTLLKSGWEVVEKHGNRLFLRVVLVLKGYDIEFIDSYVAYATATGMWDFTTWLESNKPPASKPNLSLVVHNTNLNKDGANG